MATAFPPLGFPRRRQSRASAVSAADRDRAPWAWAFWGGLIGALLAVLLFAPARWLAGAVWQASGGRVELANPQGSLWKGSAVLVLRAGAGSRDAASLPGRLQWQIQPGLGQVGLHLHADCCTPQGLQMQWQPALQGWTLQVAAHRSHWPAELLAGLGTPWNTVQLRGQLQLELRALEVQMALQRLRLQGEVQVDAIDLGSRLSTLTPLGSYRLALQGAEQPLLTLTTLGGALQLQGSGRWTPQRLQFQGEARADPAHEAALANLLNIMGRRDGARSIITL